MSTHGMRRSLTERELTTLLDGWEGQRVAVRIVVRDDELIAVLRGRLGRRTTSKPPALFWPVARSDETSPPDEVEEPGLYLHPHLGLVAEVHTGETVVEWRQAEVGVNVRRV